jgi:hypothetical protein
LWMSSLRKTSGGRRRVLLLVGGGFWAIVSAGNFCFVGVTGCLKRV